MSDKCNGLVWDMDCPAIYNSIPFKPGHKYCLLAYTDHADHWGKNIYPAIKSIALKTGYEERSVQRLTHELEEMGILITDGVGPHGTNRWKLALNRGGDKISPLGARGDIPSGDIPSGDKITPESIKKDYILTKLSEVFGSMDWWRTFSKEIENAKVHQEGATIIVSELGKEAGRLHDQYSKAINRQIIVTEYKQIIFAE